MPLCACLIHTGKHREIHVSFPLYFLCKSKYWFTLQISSNDNLIHMPLTPKISSKKTLHFLSTFICTICLQKICSLQLCFSCLVKFLSAAQHHGYLDLLSLGLPRGIAPGQLQGNYLLVGNYVAALRAGTELPGKLKSTYRAQGSTSPCPEEMEKNASSYHHKNK